MLETLLQPRYLVYVIFECVHLQWILGADVCVHVHTHCEAYTGPCFIFHLAVFG